jgi:hypothetical protein
MTGNKMKIIKRDTASTNFRVVQAKFTLGGNTNPQVGDELPFFTTEGQAEALGLVQRGFLVPVDLPPIGQYICIASFSLPGKTEKYEAKYGDVVELKADDALALMLGRYVVPKNKRQWAPFRIAERKIAPFEKYLNEQKSTWERD